MHHVVKFGGTSVANLERLQAVAERVAQHHAHKTAVVVSAMAGMTDQLVRDAQALCPAYITPAHDLVLSAGESVTCGLLALALAKRGLKARSFLGWQLPITTDKHYQSARIQSIHTEALEACFEEGIVPIVAGFQGVTDDKVITTLGRGGSDTTAVALAAALKGSCIIYTDVDGVYTADPRLVGRARRISYISLGEMLEMASVGAKILQVRSVELAMIHHVPLVVRSSFVEGEGTHVMPNVAHLNQPAVRALVHQSPITWVNIPHITPETLPMLAAEEIPLHMLQLSRKLAQFWVHVADEARLVRLLGDVEYTLSHHYAQLTLVGAGLHNNPHVLHTLWLTLQEHNVPVAAMNTSEMYIAFLIPSELLASTAALLHRVFIEDVMPKAA